MRDLLGINCRLQKTGDKIIKETEILNLLTKYGKVRIHGAYEYGLMLKPNIDIHLIPKNDDISVSRNLAKELLDSERFSEVLFFDYYHFKKEKLPKGYVIGLGIIFEDVKWNIDIYVMTADVNKNQKAHYCRDFFAQCNPEIKLEIMKCKHWLQDHNIKYDTSNLYDLFISGKYKSFDEFKEKQEKNEKICV